jgi:hypothetical protein
MQNKNWILTLYQESRAHYVTLKSYVLIASGFELYSHVFSSSSSVLSADCNGRRSKTTNIISRFYTCNKTVSIELSLLSLKYPLTTLSKARPPLPPPPPPAAIATPPTEVPTIMVRAAHLQYPHYHHLYCC